MGGAASKSSRKLPTKVPTANRAAQPTWAGGRPPVSEPTPEAEHQPTRPSDQTPPLEMYGRPIGKSVEGFSGEKDEAVRRDALDPDFAANLSRLGQVSIRDAGKFVPAAIANQRTLQSRRNETEDLTSNPPPGHLTSALLSQLFDEIKSVPESSDKSRLYQRYGMTEEKMRELREFVNSPSVGDVNVMAVVDGNERREMQAVWVDSSDSIKPPKVGTSSPPSTGPGR